MCDLAGDLALARAKGAAAARIARERFDDAVMARAYERLYLEIQGARTGIDAVGAGA
jgi:hypothetical protein